MAKTIVGTLADEFDDAELGDARRTKRLVRLADAVAKAPGASFPTLARTEAELEAIYRLLSNPRVRWLRIPAMSISRSGASRSPRPAHRDHFEH
jgi:hypothetical protein